MGLPCPDGQTQLIQETKTLSTYAYDRATIEIPAAAQRLLSPPAAPAPAEARRK